MLLHRFEYDGILIDGRMYYIRGEAEIYWNDDSISSEMGNRWVTQKLLSHRVKDVWIEHLENIKTEEIIVNIPDHILERVEQMLEEEDISYEAQNC